MRSIRIDRLLPNGDREQLTPVVERVTGTVDRVRLLMPDPGSYELHLSSMGNLVEWRRMQNRRDATGHSSSISRSATFDEREPTFNAP